jgi:hypothetical protein
MRGKTSLLRGWLRDPRASSSVIRKPADSLLSDAVYMQRKRSERSCPYDLVSLDSKFGQLKPAKPRSGPGPHVLATWVRKFPRSAKAHEGHPSLRTIATSHHLRLPKTKIVANNFLRF